MLEMILKDAEFIDVLHMSETCHGIRNVIYASHKMQVKLFLRPPKENESGQDGFISMLIKNKPRMYYFGGLSINFYILDPDSAPDSDDDSSEDNERTPCICFEKVKGRGKRPRIGAKWKDMLIAQPSIKYMKVNPRCDCSGSKSYDVQSGSIFSKTGLTLGDLLTRAKKEMKQGCICCKLDALEEQSCYGWDSDTIPSELLDAIEVPAFESILFEAYID